jgi:hypothetical protein
MNRIKKILFFTVSLIPALPVLPLSIVTPDEARSASISIDAGGRRGGGGIDISFGGGWGGRRRDDRDFDWGFRRRHWDWGYHRPHRWTRPVYVETTPRTIYVERPTTTYVDQPVARTIKTQNFWHITNKTKQPFLISSDTDEMRIVPGESQDLYYGESKKLIIKNPRGELLAEFTVDEHNIDIKIDASGKIELSVWD